MLWDIDLIFGMWMYKLVYVSFRSNDFWPSYGPWTLKFGQIFSCHHIFSLCLEILTWFLVWVYNDEIQIKFTFRSGPMICGRVMALRLKFGQIFSCHHLFHYDLRYWLGCLVWECIIISYRSTLKFICYS
jgi:hypothetical protein